MALAAQPDWAVLDTGARLRPLDAAVSYLRQRGLRVLPLYIMAMAPFSVAVLLLIDAITIQDRPAIAFACLLLTGATLWRWLGVAAVQRRVQHDLRGEPPLPLRKRAVSIVLAKLTLSPLVLWGSLVILPGIYGLFLSAVSVPVLLEAEGAATSRMLKAFGWVQDAVRRLSRVWLALVVLAGMAALAVLILHVFLLGTVLPSLLGIDAQDLRLTMQGPAWSLSVGYFLFVAFDLLWTVASVFVFYDLRSRRLGADLRLRVQALREGSQ
jgi:hypothetical protein